MNEEVRRLFEQGLQAGNLSPCRQDMALAFSRLCTCYESKGKILVCGNGGSAADSEHIVGELMKGFCKRRRIPAQDRLRLSEIFPEEGVRLAEMLQQAIPAISLASQVSLATAIANDTSADMVFAQQVYGYGLEGDVLIGISTSGNAANVLNALRVARAIGLQTIGLTGSQGGRMKTLCDPCIRVPASKNPEVQACHLWVYHTLCAMVEAQYFDE
jgi:D-sedoheptulose 7-phosphate isomerase